MMANEPDSHSQFWMDYQSLLDVDPHGQLDQLDSAFRQAIELMAQNLGGCLAEDESLHDAVSYLTKSQLFEDHNQRMTSLLIFMLTDPDCLFSVIFVGCCVLVVRGFENSNFFRSLHHLKVAEPSFDQPVDNFTDPDLLNSGVIPILVHLGARVAFLSPADWHHKRMEENRQSQLGDDHLTAETQAMRKLRPTLAGLLYELCRVQKMESDTMALFTEQFIENLFELVELTRDEQDETFSYNLIKLIVALNEQFMVAELQQHQRESSHQPTVNSKCPHHPRGTRYSPDSDGNFVLRIMKRRLDESKTFGENLIFILNRTSHATSEGLCVALLILKILYLLFTTPGTHEYFYTNDLCVLVDVFIRELSDLPEESEDLRHTYLRVLHPLLTQTQLRSYSYKRKEIRHVLLSHIKYAHIRELNPTTKRLVERNLKAEWCVELENNNDNLHELGAGGIGWTPLRSHSTETATSSGRGSMIDVAHSATPALSQPNRHLEPLEMPEVKRAIEAIAGPQVNMQTSISRSAAAESDGDSPIVQVTGEFGLVSDGPYASMMGNGNHSHPPGSLLSARSTSPMSDNSQRRPGSSSSSSAFRRPAPKPPTIKRTLQPTIIQNEMSEAHSDSSEPTSSCITRTMSDPVRQPPTPPKARRAAPTPPHAPQSGKRRKAPLPPNQDGRTLGPPRLRSTRSNIQLSSPGGTGATDQKKGHHRVVSLSERQTEMNPFEEQRSESWN